MSKLAVQAADLGSVPSHPLCLRGLHVKSVNNLAKLSWCLPEQPAGVPVLPAFPERLEDAQLEKTLESPLDFKEIKLVHTKGNQS